MIVTFGDRGPQPLHEEGESEAAGFTHARPLSTLGSTFTTDTFGAFSTAAPQPNVEGNPAIETLTAATESLEKWKIAEMKEFRASLQAKEAELLKVLAEEWKARDQEREVLLAQRADDYSKLEKQLKNAIRDLSSKVWPTVFAPDVHGHEY